MKHFRDVARVPETQSAMRHHLKILQDNFLTGSSTAVGRHDIQQKLHTAVLRKSSTCNDNWRVATVHRDSIATEQYLCGIRQWYGCGMLLCGIYTSFLFSSFVMYFLHYYLFVSVILIGSNLCISQQQMLS